MKSFRRLAILTLIIIVSSMLPLAATHVALADDGTSNLQELTSGADVIVAGTVTQRSSYWNDDHTRIYTSVVISADDTLKGTLNQDKVTVTIEGGEVGGMGLWVSDMPSFAQGEKSVLFLKKLSPSDFPGAKDFTQFQVYRGYRGKLAISGDKAGGMPESVLRDRIQNLLKGRALSNAELNIAAASVTLPYKVLLYSWPHPPAPVVHYYINENASNCTGEGAAVQAAAATWSAAGANFSFTYAGTTTATAPALDGVNEIMWVNMGYVSTLAETTIWFQGSTIIETDIEFNDYYYWSTAPTCPAGRYDVQSVGLHELGHCAGLDDLTNPSDSAKVMYGYSSRVPPSAYLPPTTSPASRRFTG